MLKCFEKIACRWICKLFFYVLRNVKEKYKNCNHCKRVCEIKSVNRHSMISDGTVSSWNELAALVYITSI